MFARRGLVRARACCAFVLVLSIAFAVRAVADELKSKGTTLTGTVKTVSAKGVAFDTEYGKGTLVVAIEDVEDVRSDGRFVVVYGPSGQTTGKILGLREGKLLVGDDAASAVEIALADVHAVVGVEGPEDSFANSMRKRLALWDGSFDVGFGITRSTADTTTFALGFLADRKKKPTRLTFQTGYNYGREKAEDGAENTTANELFGLLRGEYDFAARWFTFSSVDAEYDEVESLDIRTVPKLGAGYRFWESANGLFQVEAGGAYIYEKFSNGDDNDYFSVAFGKLFEYDLPYFGSHFHWRTDYLPSVSDWTGDYLLRSEAALLVPMYRFVNLKFAVADDYDSTPAEGAKHNTLKSTAGIAFVY